MDTPPAPLRLLRLPEVLNRIPVSKSTWWAGVASGRFPKAVRLGPRSTAWLEDDVDRLIRELVDPREGSTAERNRETYRPNNLSEPGLLIDSKMASQPKSRQAPTQNGVNHEF